MLKREWMFLCSEYDLEKEIEVRQAFTDQLLQFINPQAFESVQNIRKQREMLGLDSGEDVTYLAPEKVLGQRKELPKAVDPEIAKKYSNKPVVIGE